jgi:hypothetical protein
MTSKKWQKRVTVSRSNVNPSKALETANSENYRDPLAQLPLLCIDEIFKNLDVIDVFNASKVSRNWKATVEGVAMTRASIRSRFPTSMEADMAFDIVGTDIAKVWKRRGEYIPWSGIVQK